MNGRGSTTSQALLSLLVAQIISCRWKSCGSGVSLPESRRDIDTRGVIRCQRILKDRVAVAIPHHPHRRCVFAKWGDGGKLYPL